MKPKGKIGMEAVERLGRKTKTGGFDKIAASAEKEYGNAEEGKKVAGAIYWKMAHRTGGK